MAANGCGLFGGLSKFWKLVFRKAPAFERCCNEHDLAYEQIDTEEEREWADKHFLRCMKAGGWKLEGYIFFPFIRLFGWMSFLKRRA